MNLPLEILAKIFTYVDLNISVIDIFDYETAKLIMHCRFSHLHLKLKKSILKQYNFIKIFEDNEWVHGIILPILNFCPVTFLQLAKRIHQGYPTVFWGFGDNGKTTLISAIDLIHSGVYCTETNYPLYGFGFECITRFSQSNNIPILTSNSDKIRHIFETPHNQPFKTIINIFS